MTTEKPDPSTSLDDSINTRKASADEVAYRNGYVQGRNLESNLQYDRAREYERVGESNGVASGLILGMLLAGLVGGAAALFYWYGQTQNPPVKPTTPTSDNTQTKPNKETTIIERTIERTQEAVPASPATSNPPNINVTIPNPTAPNPTVQNPTGNYSAIGPRGLVG